jgi:RNA polymerase sigma-70 factor (ECF subfamily)
MSEDEQQVSDGALLARIRAREIDALDAFYERFKSQAFALAYRIVGGREAAEEVMQDAFLSVWRQAETYRPERGAARSWLLSIVHHRAIDHVRSAAAKRTAAPLDEAWMKPADTDVFEDAFRSVQRDEIMRALADLSGEQRETIELAYFQGCTFAEIAAVTRAPLGTVKSRARLALAKLRTLLREEIVT